MKAFALLSMTHRCNGPFSWGSLTAYTFSGAWSDDGIISCSWMGISTFSGINPSTRSRSWTLHLREDSRD
jgi:hypothetical protein